ncbi:MAG: DUF1778 domain-containing protein [Egibacteraceae bacterium]
MRAHAKIHTKLEILNPGCHMSIRGVRGLHRLVHIRYTRSETMPRHSTTERGQRDARLNLRTSAQQQQLIRSAAAAVEKSVTDFVLESATANAERVLADRRWFVLSEDEWNDFEALLDAPMARTPKLAAS